MGLCECFCRVGMDSVSGEWGVSSLQVGQTYAAWEEWVQSNVTHPPETWHWKPQTDTDFAVMTHIDTFASSSLELPCSI